MHIQTHSLNGGGGPIQSALEGWSTCVNKGKGGWTMATPLDVHTVHSHEQRTYVQHGEQDSSPIIIQCVYLNYSAFNFRCQRSFDSPCWAHVR